MQLFYREHGTKGNPVLFILHGLYGQSDNWQTLGKKMAEAGYNVFIIDLRNHGLSPHSTDWNYDFMAGDVIELCTTLGINKINLLGHSMGGKVAMHAAYEHPYLINKLIIADMGTKQYPVHHGTIIEALHACALTPTTSRKDVEATLTQRINDLATRQFLLKNLYWNSNETLAWRFNLEVIANKISAVGEESLVNKVYPQPTLFIRGGNSNYVTDADWVNIELKFTQATLHTIPNAGHWLHAEQPQAFYDVLTRYLQAK
jgi:esterase